MKTTALGILIAMLGGLDARVELNPQDLIDPNAPLDL
jgi:hypothetical protein